MLVLYHLYLLHQCLYYINCIYFINACILSIEITSSMLVLLVYQVRLLYQCLSYINWDYFINACTTWISVEITFSMPVLHVYQFRFVYQCLYYMYISWDYLINAWTTCISIYRWQREEGQCTRTIILPIDCYVDAHNLVDVTNFLYKDNAILCLKVWISLNTCTWYPKELFVWKSSYNDMQHQLTYNRST